MEATSEQGLPAQTTWADVAAASAEAEASVREKLTDVIEVKLTDADLANIARENAADDEAKAALQAQLDDLKSEMKDKKTSISAIEQRVRDRNTAVRKGTQARKGEWLVESLFETNTVRYLDPRTEQVVHERPMSVSERQIELPLGTPPAPRRLDEEAPDDTAPTDVTDPNALLAAAQRGDDASADDLDEGDDLDEDEDDDTDEDER